MSYPDVYPSGRSAAPRCTCTAVIVATFAETAACPRRWHRLPDGTWFHIPGWAR